MTLQNEIVSIIELNTTKLQEILNTTDLSKDEFLRMQNPLQYLVATINFQLKECKRDCVREQFLILQFIINPVVDKLKSIKIFVSELVNISDVKHNYIDEFDELIGNWCRMLSEHFTV
jgi:hypothetical protein